MTIRQQLEMMSAHRERVVAENNRIARRNRAAFAVWLVVAVALTGAVCMDAHHRRVQREYRAMPSADVQTVRAHKTVSELEAIQADMIRREYGKIAGQRP